MNNLSYSNQNNYHLLFRSFNSFNDQLSKLQMSFSQLRSKTKELEKQAKSSTNSKDAKEQIMQLRNKTIYDLKGIKTSLDSLHNQSHSVLQKSPRKGNTQVRTSLQGWYGNISGQCAKLQGQIDSLIGSLEASNLTLGHTEGDKTVEALAELLDAYQEVGKKIKDYKKITLQDGSPSLGETIPKDTMIDPLCVIIAFHLSMTLAIMLKKNRIVS
ncbi:hypothetical protein G3O08_00715 [Cryomorpha ignava]|uniref:Uncharacterized protein n=1 Tax=Cryomorpha ignava TaxID=101383 RepID=A0A7K3WMV6_9FLAO|nr:hypothetical protein [Cryomorpha ignava]NEN22025.1 hypothetical protein [Cryomorpha ignava]